MTGSVAKAEDVVHAAVVRGLDQLAGPQGRPSTPHVGNVRIVGCGRGDERRPVELLD